MRPTIRTGSACAAVVLAALALVASAGVSAPGEEARSRRWESAIRAFEERDRASPPPSGAVLFVGSSSIRLWDLDRCFPGLTTINRGFGGSEVCDAVAFADRIVLPYRPRVVLLYAGDNDIAAGKPPAVVLHDFQEFVAKVRTKLPDTWVYFIAIKPSVRRWALAPQMAEANRLIEEFTRTARRVDFIGIEDLLLGPDGKPRPDRFVEDGLHLNRAAYDLWSERVRLYLEGAAGKRRRL